MKKLVMIAAVMAAVAANAATFSWKTTASGKIYEAGTTTLLSSATAYLFDASKVTQAAVLTAFTEDKALSSLAYTDSTSVANGVIAQKSFDVPQGYSEGDTFSAYFALVVDDSLYISSLASGATPSTGNRGMSYNELANSQAAALDSKNGYSTAGWYAVSSSPIPEPTSGILLLLGMAGLALRRRRA